MTNTNIFFQQNDNAIRGIGAMVSVLMQNIQDSAELSNVEKKRLMNLLRAELNVKQVMCQGMVDLYVERIGG